jgi:ribulose-5-phosphate 4-epimerase/fuculose-1-phosphate aldolase
MMNDALSSYPGSLVSLTINAIICPSVKWREPHGWFRHYGQHVSRIRDGHSFAFVISSDQPVLYIMTATSLGWAVDGNICAYELEKKRDSP